MPVVANDIPNDNRIFLLPDLPAALVFGDDAPMRMALCTNRMFDAHARPLNLRVEFVRQRRPAGTSAAKRATNASRGHDQVTTKPEGKGLLFCGTSPDFRRGERPGHRRMLQRCYAEDLLKRRNRPRPLSSSVDLCGLCGSICQLIFSGSSPAGLPPGGYSFRKRSRSMRDCSRLTWSR
jgi:hypothetical protein